MSNFSKSVTQRSKKYRKKPESTDINIQGPSKKVRKTPDEDTKISAKKHQTTIHQLQNCQMSFKDLIRDKKFKSLLPRNDKLTSFEHSIQENEKILAQLKANMGSLFIDTPPSSSDLLAQSEEILAQFKANMGPLFIDTPPSSSDLIAQNEEMLAQLTATMPSLFIDKTSRQ